MEAKEESKEQSEYREKLNEFSALLNAPDAVPSSTELVRIRAFTEQFLSVVTSTPDNWKLYIGLILKPLTNLLNYFWMKFYLNIYNCFSNLKWSLKFCTKLANVIYEWES